MLGHKLFQVLRDRFDGVRTAIHGPRERWKHVDLLRGEGVIDNLEAMDLAAVKKLMQSEQPDVTVNCVGVIKQRADAAAYIPSITLNSLLPHHLAENAAEWGGRVIHFSTDCVFSGRRGNYSETDISDAEDLYGKSKFLGEVTAPNALTLRTSMIGYELSHFQSLLEWFLRQTSSRVEGYTRAIYSGLTTIRVANIVGDIIERHAGLSGLYQVTGQTISKFELLKLIQQEFRVPVEVVPDSIFSCDRSMSGEKFREATGFEAPEWPQLIKELAEDKTPYDRWTNAQ